MTTVSSDWSVVAFPEEGPPVRRDTPPPRKEWETLCGRFVQIPGPSESGAATLTSQRFDLGGILANWERICNSGVLLLRAGTHRLRVPFVCDQATVLRRQLTRSVRL
jgi:hypothetical protein